MNNSILTGNLGDDPKSFYTPDGAQIVTFDLAFRTGKDKTSWIRITCFQKLAELAVKYLHKGARVGIVGRLDQTKWTTEDNQQRSSFRIIANQLLPTVLADGSVIVPTPLLHTMNCARLVALIVALE